MVILTLFNSGTKNLFFFNYPPHICIKWQAIENYKWTVIYIWQHLCDLAKIYIFTLSFNFLYKTPDDERLEGNM